ncbi:hypothetical protein AMAG_06921 [Allomyces macrogynus ATCC 38327]|uniref:Uncharacterized protein n=1 Tax=Allomyces macrogynus (strain ATCC 38327) TaxID=578462 RepID=A0A0L0SFM3_ALLM3|nr:hypothetical protein AMAG_06921 [Allomyces macrogynus ATCC 38327]|eukprot:KNE61170.1 hypothetical protein AMAG_06921 [Allomyces macrogynus ATCC 38327]
MLPAPAQYPAVETAATRILDAAPASVRSAADTTCAPPRASGTRHLAPLTHAAEAHRGIQTKFLIARHSQWPNHPFFRCEPAPDERVFPWPAACHAPNPAALLARMPALPSVASTPSVLMSPRDPRRPRAGSLASSSTDTLTMPPPPPPAPAPMPPMIVPPLLPPPRAIVPDARMVASPAHVPILSPTHVPIMSPAHIPAAMIPHAHARAPSMDRATVTSSASLTSSRASAARDPRDRASPETLKRRGRSPSPDRGRGARGRSRDAYDRRDRDLSRERDRSRDRSWDRRDGHDRPRDRGRDRSRSRSRDRGWYHYRSPSRDCRRSRSPPPLRVYGRRYRSRSHSRSPSPPRDRYRDHVDRVRPGRNGTSRPLSPPSAKITPTRSASSSATPSISRSRLASPVPPDMSPPPPPLANRASDKSSKPDMPLPSVARRTDADATRGESWSRTASASSAVVTTPPARAGSESNMAPLRVAPPSMSRDDSSPELPRRPSVRASTSADKTASHAASVDAQRDPTVAVVPAEPRRRSSTSEHSPPPPPHDPRQSVSESRSSNGRGDREMRESRASSSTTLTSSPTPMSMPPPPPPPAAATNPRPPAARQGSIRLPSMPMVVVEVPRPTLRRKKAAASMSAAPDKKKVKLATSSAAGSPPPQPPKGPAPSLNIPMAPVPDSARAQHAAALTGQDSGGHRGLGSVTNGDAMRVDHFHHHERFSDEEVVKDEVDEDEPMELDEDLPTRFEPHAPPPPPHASVSRLTPGPGSAKHRPTATASMAAANSTDQNGVDDDSDGHTLTIPVALAAAMPRACRALFALPGAEEVGAHTRTACFVDEAIDVVRKDFMCSRHPPPTKLSATGKPKVRIIRSVEPAGSHRERCFKCNECGVRLLPPRLFEEVVRQRFVEQFDLGFRIPALFGHLEGTRIKYADGTVGDRIPGSPVQWMRDAAAAVAEGQPAEEAVHSFEPASLPANVQADLMAFVAAGKKAQHRGFSNLNAGDIGGELLRSLVPSTPCDQRAAAGAAPAGSTASASTGQGPPRARSSKV